MGRCAAQKIVLVGPTGSGKTALACRYLHNFYPFRTKPTTDFEFFSKMVWTPSTSCLPSHVLQLQIWDVASCVTKNNLYAPGVYYKDAFIIFLCIDLYAENWQTECEFYLQHINQHKPPSASVILLATKVECENNLDQELVKLHQQYSSSYRIICASAKEEQRTLAPFNLVIERHLQQQPLRELRAFCTTDQEFSYLLEVHKLPFLYERLAWAKDYYGDGRDFLSRESSHSFGFFTMWDDYAHNDEGFIKRNILMQALSVQAQSELTTISKQERSWRAASFSVDTTGLGYTN